MKKVLFIFIIALVLSGCYTERFVSEVNINNTDGNVRFFLADSSSISAVYYEENSNNYRIVGEMSTYNFDVIKFNGYVNKKDIIAISVEEIDWYATIIPSSLIVLLFISL